MPASAEVMDKEMAPSDISRTLLLSLLFALPAAAIHRWLLLPLFIFGPVRDLAYAWTEWHDPFVGTSISHEAGPSYGLLADGAMAVSVVAYLVLWLLSSWLRHRVHNSLHDLLFSAALFGAAALHAVLGFSVTWGPFLSMPMILAGTALCVTATRFTRARLAGP